MLNFILGMAFMFVVLLVISALTINEQKRRDD